MIDDIVKELRELREKATQGKWFQGWICNGKIRNADPYDGHFLTTKTTDIAGNFDCEDGGIINPDDAEYIASLHNNLPTLLSRLEELESRLSPAWLKTKEDCDKLIAMMNEEFAEEAAYFNKTIEQQQKQLADYEGFLKELAETQILCTSFVYNAQVVLNKYKEKEDE